MRDDVRKALEFGSSPDPGDRTIDITTTGRRSGEPRRIETVFYRVGGEIYLTGLPGDRPRAWLLNLAAEPRFTFHLKGDVSADLPATATVIDDPQQRRAILAPVVDDFNRRHGPDSPWPRAELDEWLTRSPLAHVAFDDAD
jgi:deazaflavin-dependent oxidoreductase (nitroreductase family)